LGIYLNQDNYAFEESLQSQIYVDKSGLIGELNKVVRTKQKFVCVSRPRRFGKSMAAEMINAYYSRGCDSKEMFSGLKISKDSDFEKHLNKYNVIHINMAEMSLYGETIEDKLSALSMFILNEMRNEFSDVGIMDSDVLIMALKKAFAAKKIPFIFIIDEWDCIFREHKDDEESQKKYLDFLRGLLKDQVYVALAYMTGILPIKKYGVHSALNMFTEISMVDTGAYAEFTGFTEDEVKVLCDEYDMSFEDTKMWYDGYDVEGIPTYNPRSVVTSMLNHKFSNYWTSTETYEALKVYIEMNFDGLRDRIDQMLSGQSVYVDTTTFTNDMVSFKTADDVLTLLVHLGYLTYDSKTKTVKIPNHEIEEQFVSTVKVIGWDEVVKSLKISEELLQYTLDGNEEKVAELIEKAHDENASFINYNNENSLACVVSLAYYSARKSYEMYREQPAGKGYADIVFVPRRNNPNPPIVVELKYDKDARGAVEQIRAKGYEGAIKDYHGEVICVGINYEKKSKKHECVTERITV